jgi:hypothetical protein
MVVVLEKTAYGVTILRGRTKEEWLVVPWWPCSGGPSARLRRPSCPANGSMNAPALQTMNSRGVQHLLGSAPRKNRKAARALVVAALAKSGLPPPCGI